MFYWKCNIPIFYAILEKQDITGIVNWSGLVDCLTSVRVRIHIFDLFNKQFRHVMHGPAPLRPNPGIDPTHLLSLLTLNIFLSKCYHQLKHQKHFESGLLTRLLCLLVTGSDLNHSIKSAGADHLPRRPQQPSKVHQDDQKGCSQSYICPAKQEKSCTGSQSISKGGLVIFINLAPSMLLIITNIQLN